MIMSKWVDDGQFLLFNDISHLIQQQKGGMQQLAEQLKTMIHHILYRYKFYRMNSSQFHQILQLLNQPQPNNPHLIQQYVFRGIVTFNQNYKDQIASVLSNPIYQHISMETKAFLHKIMHEFHFLNSIRAYQMFQERFQQPASLSQERDSNQNLPFDDEFQKARLHYMYYGPYSIYHMNGIISQPPITQAPQIPIPHPFHDSYPHQDVPQKIVPHYEFKPIKAIEKNNNQRDLFLPNQQIERHYAPIRGRPPKDKRKLYERYTRRISQQLKKLLLLYHRYEEIRQERDQNLQYCVCRGFLDNSQTFICSRCNRQFHQKCCGNSPVCLGCNLKTRDPFLKITETLGLFYLDWWQNYTFEQQINMKSFVNMCATGRFEIMLSCILASQPHITYPDNSTFSINGQPIFTVPPILQNHSTNRRKDTSHLITPFIFQQSNYNTLQKTKFTLEANNFPNNQNLRDNRKGIFLLGIFLVQKISIADLQKNIISANQNNLPINPLEDINMDEELEIEALTVSCYDPFTKKLIQIPVKGEKCVHINCFDLKTYLTFEWSSLERLWLCPLCKKELGTLKVDKFQLRILSAVKNLNKLPLKVTYHKNGKIDLQQQGQQMEQSQQSSLF